MKREVLEKLTAGLAHFRSQGLPCVELPELAHHVGLPQRQVVALVRVHAHKLGGTYHKAYYRPTQGRAFNVWARAALWVPARFRFGGNA